MDCRKSVLYDIATGTSHRIEFPESAYAVATGENAEFDTNVLRITYESLTTPHSVYDYDMTTHERKLLKQQPVKGGYDANRYQTRTVVRHRTRWNSNSDLARVSQGSKTRDWQSVAAVWIRLVRHPDRRLVLIEPVEPARSRCGSWR